MLALYLAFTGCSNPETLPEGDISGRVIIPKLAATRTVVSAVDSDGDGVLEYSSAEITDPRLLGPVYIGAFAEMDTFSFSYVHPAMGPATSTNTRGDTFPYGGVTVGRLDFACYQVLACKVTTGRFADYDELLDYARNILGQPVNDQYGNAVDDGEMMRAACYQYFAATSDDEMAFIGEDNLSFEEDGDNYVADFKMLHTNRVEGMALWGFMDAPVLNTQDVSRNGAFTTCDPTSGRDVFQYETYFQEGGSYFDVLNLPSTYIQLGDWVADGQASVSFDEELNQKESVDVNLNFEFAVE